MSDISPSIYHLSPKELVVIEVTINGTIVTTGYQVCVLPTNVTPDEDHPAWQEPDTAGDDTGVFVGTDTSNVFDAGKYGQPWYWLTDTPEVVIKKASPTVYFT